MPSQVRGVNDRAIRQIEESFDSDRYGVDILTLVEEVPADIFPAALRSRYSVHPVYTAMGCSRRSGQKGKGGRFWRMTYIYEGFFDSLPEPTYELSGTLDEVPIQTHPDFSEFAGTPSAPANGAVFIDPDTGKITEDDEKGVFREFKATIGGSPNDFGGIESFLDPGAVFTKVSFTTVQPSLRQLGTIQAPDGPAPALGGRNWMYLETNSRRRGYIYEARESWRLSGRGGWNSTIY